MRALILILVLLSSCAHDWRRGEPISSLRLDGGLSLIPAAPAAFGQRDLGQLLVFHRDGQEAEFHARVEITEQELTIVGLTPLGEEAFVLTWDGSSLRFLPHPAVPFAGDPRGILADFCLAFAPAAFAWEGKSPGCRVLRDSSGQALLTLEQSGDDPWSSEITITHHRYGYQLSISPE
ncbi:MAG: hypothetical protein RL095_3121 [Verrucomicrobiota bacterium]|jgi:hypothetical protein